MKTETRKFLEKAEQAIVATKALVQANTMGFAAGRAYYAIFYVASAILCEKGMHFRKHSGVHAAFGEHLVKTGALDAKYHRWLLEAYNKRVEGDYGVDVVILEKDVNEMLDQASKFLEEANRYLGAG